MNDRLAPYDDGPEILTAVDALTRLGKAVTGMTDSLLDSSTRVGDVMKPALRGKGKSIYMGTTSNYFPNPGVSAAIRSHEADHRSSIRRR